MHWLFKHNFSFTYNVPHFCCLRLVNVLHRGLKIVQLNQQIICQLVTITWYTPTQMFIIDRPDSTEKRPQLPDSPVRLGPHNWLQRIFAQTGILSLSGGYKEEEERRGHELLHRYYIPSPGLETGSRAQLVIQ